MENSIDTKQREREARRHAVTEAWYGSSDIRAFVATLEKAGYILARDERHSYAVIDFSGGTHSLIRQIEDVKPKEIRARLESISGELPDVRTAQDRARRWASEGKVAVQDREEKNLIQILAPRALLVIGVFLAYANVYHNEFLYDDIPLIRDNKFLTSWSYIGTLFVSHTQQGYGNVDPLYRPLQLLLYLFIYQTTGASTVVFHLLNVSLHALNSCLLYTLGVRMKFQRGAVILAALLWAVHPVHAEAVTYVSGTGEILYGVFLIASILVLVPGFSPRRILAACFLFVLGLLSKETAVVFPVLAMGLLFYGSENRWSPKIYLKTWPFWLIAVLYLTARATMLNFGGAFGYYDSNDPDAATIWDRFCTFLATLPTYLRLLVWPTGLHMERIFPYYKSLWTAPAMAGLAILIALLTGITWKPARRASPLAWGILWAGALFIPVSGILVPNDAVIAENWLYLPTSGFALGVGENLARVCAHIRVRQLKSALVGLTVLIACLLGTVTFEQNKFWRDRITFYTHILDCGEDTARIRANLGSAYEEKGEYKLAIEQYRAAVAISDSYANGHYDLGAALINDAQEPYMLKTTAAPPDLNTPEFAEGVKEFQRALELDPDFFRAYDVLAYIYGYYLRDQTKALEYHAKALTIRKKLGIE